MSGKSKFEPMQMQLPLFPQSVKLINATVGVFQKEDMVYYLHNGSPVFCHHRDDLNNFRYILAQLVVNGLCKCHEIGKALAISDRNVQRYAKTLREKGSDWFFNRVEHRGECYKLNAASMEKAQRLLDAYWPAAQIARELNVSEGALRYHITKGTLKKNR